MPDIEYTLTPEENLMVNSSLKLLDHTGIVDYLKFSITPVLQSYIGEVNNLALHDTIVQSVLPFVQNLKDKSIINDYRVVCDPSCVGSNTLTLLVFFREPLVEKETQLTFTLGSDIGENIAIS